MRVTRDEVGEIIGQDPEGPYPVKILVFTLSEMGRHWGIQHDRIYVNLPLATGLRVDHRRERETG